jgi:hypothetical protein
MNDTTTITLDEALARPVSPRQQAALARLKNIRDKEIDFSDTPELTDGELATASRPARGGVRPGAGRKPSGNVALYVRVPAPWAAGYRAEARKTKRPLSTVVLSHLRHPAGMK